MTYSRFNIVDNVSEFTAIFRFGRRSAKCKPLLNSKDLFTGPQRFAIVFVFQKWSDTANITAKKQHSAIDVSFGIMYWPNSNT
jgi:hypothetical protein